LEDAPRVGVAESLRLNKHKQAAIKKARQTLATTKKKSPTEVVKVTCDASTPEVFLLTTKRRRSQQKRHITCCQADNNGNEKDCASGVGIVKGVKLDKHRLTDIPKARQKLANVCKNIGAFHLTLFGVIKNVKRCYGCGKAFSRQHLKSPHDLILKHFCHRQYRNKDGVEVVSPMSQAAYFHLNLDCARKIEPNMEREDIIVHSEIRQKLTEKHKQLLVGFGIKVD